MAIVKLGVLNDPHIVAEVSDYSDWFDDALQECGPSQVDCDHIWVLGDNISNFKTYTTWSDDIYDDYYEFTRLLNNYRTFTKQCCPGNHDIWKDVYQKFLGPTCSVKIISGLRFIVIDTTPKNLRTPLWSRAMHEEQFGHVDQWVLDWLKEELDSDTSIPTFIGCHHGLLPHTFGSEIYRLDTTCSVGHNYALALNHKVVNALIEDSNYNVVAVFQAHNGHAYHHPVYITQNGVDYFFLKHGRMGGFGYDRICWVYLDTTTPSNSRVYSRMISTHADTQIKALSW